MTDGDTSETKATEQIPATAGVETCPCGVTAP
jgi:hypothetical protein